MTAVTLSPKYQLVLPADLRHDRGYKPGMKFTFIDDGASVNLVPVRGIKSLRGRLKGRLQSSDVEREEEDRPL
jgi:bifunctional DNA-binding transcriptional regulator/antitoxin component of YhaV-PrlF toxin-antitoxin module